MGVLELHLMLHLGIPLGFCLLRLMDSMNSMKI
jgi:hypothetical protein